MVDVASFGVEIEQSALNCGFNDQSETFCEQIYARVVYFVFI